VFRLSALITVVLDRLVQMVIRSGDALLAIVSFGDSRSRKQRQTGGQYCRPDDGLPIPQVDLMSHSFSLPLESYCCDCCFERWTERTLPYGSTLYSVTGKPCGESL
jgi:hypothetical protein